MKTLSQIYSFFSGIHRGLYDKGIKKSVRVSKPVISVGNVTFGGTGKTPFVLKLVEATLKMGFKPAIVVKSYKGSLAESTYLTAQKAQQPEIFGDEACWYFGKVSVPIYTGPKKWQSAVLADANPEVNLIIIDDGFQHHVLHRDTDIVLVDAVAGISSLTNRIRESLLALNRADTIVVTRANLVSKEVLKEFIDFIPSQRKKIFLNHTIKQRLRDLNGLDFQMQGNRVGLVSGIANPQSFKSVFEQTYPGTKVLSLEFADHHAYQQEDLKKIESFIAENKLDFVVMTEKDEIKLKKLIVQSGSQILKDFKVLEIETRFENEDEWLNHLRGLIK